MEIAIVILLTAIIILFALQYFKRPQAPAGPDNALLMQQ
jgi:FlaG/FlaF family flagellin (archaellin)